MLLSALSFFTASPFYVKPKANTSLISGLIQVIVASYKNRNMKLSSQATEEMYHKRKGSMLLVPSENLRYLNKACVKEAHAAVKGSAQSARVSQSRNQQSLLRSFASSASLL
ncbi:hypothetical protein WN943_000489 [Citrus x changshan-huyou]